MHVSKFISCRIIYNGDYSDEITITNMDNTSVPIGKKAEIETTALKIFLITSSPFLDVLFLLKLRRINQFVKHPK